MKLSLFCKNLISQGKINEQSLKVGEYKFDYDVELDKTFTLFTLKNLKPGLSQGFIIEKILFDGFEINHWKDYNYILVNNEKFFICDPTYIGAGPGMAMGDMKNQSPEIIVVNKSK